MYVSPKYMFNTCGEEVGELPAGIAGAVVAVSPGQQAGDGAQEVEHHHGEGIPVTETWEAAFRGMVYNGDKETCMYHLWWIWLIS